MRYSWYARISVWASERGPFSCRSEVAHLANDGLIAKVLGRFRRRSTARDATTSYFRTLTEYNPAFRTWHGGVYEMELTRACIHAFASSCSKGEPHIKGNGRPELVKAFEKVHAYTVPYFVRCNYAFIAQAAEYFVDALDIPVQKGQDIEFQVHFV